MNLEAANNSQINNHQPIALGAHFPPSNSRQTYDMEIKFNEVQQVTPTERQLKNIIHDKIRNKEFFYGIEISARNYNPNTVLDYRLFGAVLPLFTSIVWLSSEYWTVTNVEEIESIKLARKLQTHSVVLPHLSCYHLNTTRLRNFLNLNYSNVLAVRGDFYEQNQEYKYSGELVASIRQWRGDSITICVGGYPEGHPECLTMEEDLNNLVKKVQAGADFIITQICFSAQTVVEFIKNCRTRGIKIPILVGIFVPDNLRLLETMLRITKITMLPEILEEYRSHDSLGRRNFTSYAVRKAVEMIETIFASDVEVYGLQFFTMNKFKNIPKVLNEIHKNGKVIKGT